MPQPTEFIYEAPLLGGPYGFTVVELLFITFFLLWGAALGAAIYVTPPLTPT
jgi:hypothetical protein